MYSLKQAIILKETFGIDVKVYYTDIRATGRGYEELYWRAQEAGVQFIRGKAAEVWHEKGGNSLIVRAEDTLTGAVTEEAFDMVALAVAMVPPEELAKFADSFSLPLGEDGFVQELHPKLDPVNTIRPGVYSCGCALGPKDVRDTVSDSLAAASKTSSFLKEGTTSTNPEKSFVEKSLCNGCQACIAHCPAGAITSLEGKAYVDPFLCKGCGGCVPECPTGAIEVKNSTSEQILASLTGILRSKKKNEIRLVAFVDNSIGYTGVDFLGQDRTSYPHSVRVIPVPTTAIISFEQLLHAFSLGADGIVMIEGDNMIHEDFTKERIKGFSEALEELGIDSMRLYYSLVQLPSYKNIKRIFDLNTSIIEDLEPINPETIEGIKEKLGK
jgi:heterodisulfide reductase subunit A